MSQSRHEIRAAQLRDSRGARRAAPRDDERQADYGRPPTGRGDAEYGSRGPDAYRPRAGATPREEGTRPARPRGEDAAYGSRPRGEGAPYGSRPRPDAGGPGRRGAAPADEDAYTFRSGRADMSSQSGGRRGTDYGSRAGAAAAAGEYGRRGSGGGAGGRGPGGRGPGGPGGPRRPGGPGDRRRGGQPEPEETRDKVKRYALATLKWGSLAGLVLAIIGVIGVVIAYNNTEVPEGNKIADLQVSVIYYSDGKTELDRIAVADGNRESVKLADVPAFVQDAHIAAEDREFYTNNGISLAGILRAVQTSITGDRQVGGSTITQQYVKNYYLTQDRTLSRKAKEILIAMKIDSQRSKAQILEDYLNTIYYGRGAYGIQSAAKTYFGKDVEKLTVSEAAVLASVINAPLYFDPANGEKAEQNLRERVDYVLDGMVTMGKLSQAERDKITDLPKVLPPKQRSFGSGPKGYITAEVRKELLAKGMDESLLERGGLRVVTTIDKNAQKNAEAAMKKNLPKGVTGGLVAIKPGDGAVMAMYGGADWRKSQLNTSTQAILQAGSNFKPFAVLGAVRDGVSTKTQFDGDSPQDFADVTVSNFGDRDYGMVDMRRMIGRSINTAFVALNESIGPSKTRQAAIDAGIPEKTKGLDLAMTNVLGSASPHVIDMASAYSTIASQGIRSQPYLVSKVTSTTTDYRYEAEPKTQRAFEADVTADTTDAMTYTVKDGGTATKLQKLNRPIAGKTGTSEENRSIWFSGFVPQMAVSVGLYKPDENGNMQTITTDEGFNATGGTIPADIFFDFMQPTMEGVEVLPFPERKGVGDENVTTTATTTEAPTTTTTTEAPTTTTTTKVPGPPTTKKEPGKPTTTEGTFTVPIDPTLTATDPPPPGQETTTATDPAVADTTKPGKN